MNYRITQKPDLPEVLEEKRFAFSVNPPESIGNFPESDPETVAAQSELSGLLFPASFSKVAEALNDLGFKVNVNTLKGRWTENYIEPILGGLNCPLWKENGITAFGFNAISLILQRCIFAGLEGGDNVAPETLRGELIERYGLKADQEVLTAATAILQRSKRQKEQAESEQESSALARVETKSQAEILIEAVRLRNLAKSIKSSEKRELLSAAEKVQIFAEEMEREAAIELFRQQVRDGEVSIEDVL